MSLIKIKQVSGLQANLNDLAAAGDDILDDAKSYADSLDTAQSIDIVDGVSEAKSYADSLDTDMGVRVTDLEAVIIEDDEFVIQTLVGNVDESLEFTVTTAAQDDQVGLVWAYVNGHSVEVANVDGTTITLTNPGYVIDETDTVKFHYQTVTAP